MRKMLNPSPSFQVAANGYIWHRMGDALSLPSVFWFKLVLPHKQQIPRVLNTVLLPTLTLLRSDIFYINVLIYLLGRQWLPPLSTFETSQDHILNISYINKNKLEALVHSKGTNCPTPFSSLLLQRQSWTHFWRQLYCRSAYPEENGRIWRYMLRPAVSCQAYLEHTWRDLGDGNPAEK